jgi:glycosyltransferase involved in cell wall biosynthesis
MNLLFTITAYPPSIGGAQIHTHQLIRALQPQHRVQVFSFWDTNRTDWLMGTTLRVPPIPQEYNIDGIQVHQPGFSFTEKLRMAPFVLGYYPLMGICIPVLANTIHSQLELYADQLDLVHYVRIGREPLGFASLAVAQKHGIPFIMTPLHHPRWDKWLYRYYHHLYRQADALLVLSEAEKKTLVSLGASEQKIFVMGIGPVLADTANAVRFRSRFGLSNAPIVLFLGQKYAYKGVEVLLQSTKKVWEVFPETRFVFIGPRTNYSKTLFTEYLDPRITELDTVDLQTKTDALKACDLLCMPSSQESFGGVYVESWSMEKPVIGCDIPAVTELIQDGQNGFLVSQSAIEIADRILILLKDPVLAQSMGQAGHKLVEARFTWKQIAQSTEYVYKTLS